MTRTLFAFLLCLCCAAFAQTHSDDEYETCYAFMKRINLKTTFENAKKKAIEAQLSRNPMMANFKPEIVAFANKYFKYESLKKEIADLFLEHFTAPELKKAASVEKDNAKVAEFYQSDLGKKFKEKQPLITQQAIKLASQRLAAHQPELQAAIQKKIQQVQGK
ncbi:MAG: DUF2059 domain-containing protein [Victivallales bacterium]|nr:DUF2059 domain-containing protein [Victivallales bacterium]